MNREFHILNRKHILEKLPVGSVLILFSGKLQRKRADENYLFFSDRNFVYLTGISTDHDLIYMAVKDDAATHEKLYILPHDPMAERWTGKRITADEATCISGIEDISYTDEFESCFKKYANYSVWLDIDNTRMEHERTDAQFFSDKISAEYASVRIENARPLIAEERTIKKPCELEAMRIAEDITRDGILAMMHNARPGMYEYELKALYDQALTRRGCLEPGFPSIISVGSNNFCIHYYGYRGQAHNGDMVLNDVGAQYDNIGCDVSRGYPVSGKFNDRQKLLYECAFRTSQHMFSIIKPGYVMKEVDGEIRNFNAQNLKDIGLISDLSQVGKYMWHGGAHHIGYDTHDIVKTPQIVTPGMTFCVDVGIYVEEWGIGFRLEDNCLVTDDGCENLSASIPRSVDEIEAEMRRR